MKFWLIKSQIQNNHLVALGGIAKLLLLNLRRGALTFHRSVHVKLHLQQPPKKKKKRNISSLNTLNLVLRETFLFLRKKK